MHLGAREFRAASPSSCAVGPYPYAAGSFQDECSVFHFWSYHSGGANFAMADGSVRLLSYGANDLMPALASRAGGEPVTAPE